MSKVYSFRLSEDNPREILAREMIDAKISQGYSLRQILTEALISYGDNQGSQKGLDKYIDQLTELIQELDIKRGSSIRSDHALGLSSSFVNAMKRSAKQGISSAIGVINET